MTNMLKIFSAFKLKGGIKFFKNAKQRVFSSTTKKGQKHENLWRTCQTVFFHAKPLLKRSNVWNLTFKMPTWQPDETSAVEMRSVHLNCAREHTRRISLGENDKFALTGSTVLKTTTSRKRQFVKRKVAFTIYIYISVTLRKVWGTRHGPVGSWFLWF